MKQTFWSINVIDFASPDLLGFCLLDPEASKSVDGLSDVNENSLRLWFKKYVDQEKPVHSNVTNQELRAELKRLRVQLDEVQMERDILKKAMIYFVSESNVG